MKQDLSFYFSALAHGLANNVMGFSSTGELINFAMLDILSNMFHSISTEESKKGFIEYLRQIASSLEEANDAKA